VTQSRSALFRGRHFEDVIIIVYVPWCYVHPVVFAVLAQVPESGGDHWQSRAARTGALLDRLTHPPCPHPGDEWRELPTKEQQEEERPRPQ
jgi:hypothetical protein